MRDFVALEDEVAAIEIDMPLFGIVPCDDMIEVRNAGDFRGHRSLPFARETGMIGA
jgi:hypothetical protein